MRMSFWFAEGFTLVLKTSWDSPHLNQVNTFRVGRIMLPQSVCFLNPGKRQFANVIEVKSLEMERLLCITRWA